MGLALVAERIELSNPKDFINDFLKVAEFNN